MDLIFGLCLHKVLSILINLLLLKKVSNQLIFSTTYGGCILDEANGAQLFFHNCVFYQHSRPQDRGCSDKIAVFG